MTARRSLAFVLVSLAAWCWTLAAALAAVAAEDPSVLWAGLAHPAFDPQKVAAVERIELHRDAATIQLSSGSIGFGQPVAGRVFAAAFRGQGRLRVAPTRLLEIQQLQLHTKAAALDQEFTEAMFFFSDATYDEISSQVRFGSGDATGLQQIYWDRNDTLVRYGLNWEPRVLKALLAADPGRHRFFRAEFHTKDFGWVSLAVDASEPEEFSLSAFDEARLTVNTWVQQPAGQRSIEQAYKQWIPRQDFLVERYAIDATVNPDTELSAATQAELKVQYPGERVLLFGLDPNLRVTQVQDAAGRPWTFFQPRDPKDDPFLGSYLVVVAPEALAPGPLTLEFHYSGKRVVRTVGTGNFFCRSYGWYPTYATDFAFATRSHFEITLRVPKKYVAVAVGKQVGEALEGDFAVTRWQSEIPLAVAGFAYGDYKVEAQQVGNLQVVVYANKTPDDVLRSIELLGRGDSPGIFLPNPTGPPVPVPGGPRLNPNPPPAALGSLSPARLTKVMASEVGGALQLFENYFGPYPYQKLAISNIPYSYGQGWPSLLYISSLSFLDSTQRNQLGIRDQVEITDRFRAHETSHQWWGHAVSWRSYHDQWLSEGFAEYSGMLYTLFRRDPNEFFSALREARRQLLQKDRYGAVSEEVGPIYAGSRLSSSLHPEAYSVIVYSKGAWVLHMLRMLLYNPRDPNPDSRFIATMQDFTKTYFNQAASTEDFKRIVEKHMTPQMDLEGNGRMDWFFNQWVYSTGIPHYEFSYSIDPGPNPNTYLLKGRIRQSGVPASFKMPVPVYLRQGKRTMLAGWIIAAGPETTFEAPLGFKPDKVTLNEQEDILCTVDYR